DIDADDNALCAEACRELIDERRLRQRRAVDRYLVGAGREHGFRVADRANAAGDAERDIELARNALDPRSIDAARFGARRDVVEHELVRALLRIAARELDDVADDAMIAEAHALDDGTVRDIEARD